MANTCTVYTFSTCPSLHCNFTVYICSVESFHAELQNGQKISPLTLLKGFVNAFNYSNSQYWEWSLLKAFTQPLYGVDGLLQGITSYLSWLWSHLLMYLLRKPFSPMSNGFGSFCRKQNYIHNYFLFFAKNPYLKTNGVSHLIIFSLKDPKQDSMKNS